MEEYIIVNKNEKIEDDLINEDGSIILLEKEIFRTKNIKICVKSKELTHHNRPHAHAYYGEKEYSIAIDSKIEVLGNTSDDKYSRFLIKNYFTEEILQKAREFWNKYTDSNMKFKKNNKFYLSDYEKLCLQ